jgi:adenylate cyclase
VRSQHAAALELAQEVLDLGTTTGDDGLVVQGNLDCGWSYFFQGELGRAREHLERVLALYDAERHGGHVFTFGDDPATSAGGGLAQVLWLLGFPDAALSRSEETLRALRGLKHAYSLVFGLDLAAFVRQYRNDPAATRALVDEAIVASEKHALSFIGAIGSILQGWVLTHENSLAGGIRQMRDGLVAQLATGAEFVRPFWYCLQAEASGRAGQFGEGLALLDEAERVVQETNERYWEAEVHRTRGHLLTTGGLCSSSEAMDCYQRALGIARRQDARSLELRAATSLALLLRRDGNRPAARDVLLPVFQSFTEGFDTSDVREAAALLTDLGVPVDPQSGAIGRGQ